MRVQISLQRAPRSPFKTHARPHLLIPAPSGVRISAHEFWGGVRGCGMRTRTTSPWLTPLILSLTLGRRCRIMTLFGYGGPRGLQNHEAGGHWSQDPIHCRQPCLQTFPLWQLLWESFRLMCHPMLSIGTSFCS